MSQILNEMNAVQDSLNAEKHPPILSDIEAVARTVASLASILAGLVATVGQLTTKGKPGSKPLGTPIEDREHE